MPIALVTGAGSGIGRAIALQLAAHGYSLALVGRTEHRIEETARAAGATDGKALLLAGDVGVASFAADCVDRTVERFGGLDVLVNNAGTAAVHPIESVTESILLETFRTNAFAPALLVARAWPTFRRQRRGVVVNISSIASFDPFPGFLAYGGSKAALDSFTRSIAKEGRAIGVTAYGLNPGAVETPLLRSMFPVSALPASKAHDPAAIAAVAVACALGERPGDNGRPIPLPSP
jgi:NAD(P)-dependent dehydrogenase (short-subunit alcohol dehydrogenase family)